MSKGKTVFVFNVDQETQDLICRLAESLGHQVECFSEPQQLIQVAETGRGCVIADLKPSSTEKVDVQALLADNFIALPVIFVAMEPNVPEVVEAMRNGAVTVLQKPVQETQLQNALQESLAIDEKTLQRQLQRTDYQRRLASLSSNEQVVLELICEGHSNKIIAKKLDVSIRTVELRRHNIFKNLQVKSVVEAVRLVVMAK